MPQMDGIAATVKLRETSNIPIILLTAKSEDSDKILGLNIGADDYINDARHSGTANRSSHLESNQSVKIPSARPSSV